MEITCKVSNLYDINYLRSIIPGITNIQIEKIFTNGCSASDFYTLHVSITGETIRYFLKQTDITKDWLSLRSNDAGREAILLSSPKITPLWKIIKNPYIAVAIEKNTYALLMGDVSSSVTAINDLRIDEIDTIALKTLAKIHALFWEDQNIQNERALMELPNYFHINGPSNDYSDTTQRIGLKIFRGWGEAEKLLPQRTFNWLKRSSKEVAKHWANYPCTLLHGDFRPMNFGIDHKQKQLVLIDWAFSGFGPCTIDLFWYLISTSNLRDDREKPLKIYRSLLEAELGYPLTKDDWEQLSEIGIVSSCYMLLWEKALQYKTDKSEWEWWANKLEEVVKKYI